MTLLPAVSVLEREAIERQMRGSYQSRVLFGLLDFQHQWVIPEQIAPRSSGAVQVRTNTEGVTRSLAIDLWDPTDMLGLGTGVADVTPNRMVSIRRGIYVDEFSRWFDIPVFLGPVTKPDWADDFLSLEAQDKTSFAVVHRSNYTIKTGTNVATAMRQVMRDVVGETRFRIASTTRKLTKTHNLTTDYTPWQFIQKAARSLGWVAFYDAEGYFVARPGASDPAIEFRKGPGGSLTSTVKSGYWTEGFVNRVIVTGKVVAGVAVEATATLPADHKLSAQSMRVGDKPLYYDERISDTDLATTAECAELARSVLAQKAVQQTTASFETVPFWHMQENDPYLVETQRGMVPATVGEMTIPLGGEPQSFGHLKPTPRARASSFSVRTNSARVQAARRKAAAKKKGARR